MEVTDTPTHRYLTDKLAEALSERDVYKSKLLEIWLGYVQGMTARQMDIIAGTVLGRKHHGA